MQLKNNKITHTHTIVVKKNSDSYAVTGHSNSYQFVCNVLSLCLLQCGEEGEEGGLVAMSCLPFPKHLLSCVGESVRRVREVIEFRLSEAEKGAEIGPRRSQMT